MTSPADEKEMPWEEWRPVKGFEGYYEVSSCGRIKGLRHAHGPKSPCVARGEGGEVMSKFRKKPVVIEAVQFDPNKAPWPEGVIAWETHGPRPRDMSWGYIETLEGKMSVIAGDWIITGIKGEKYPCKPDIFEATYEPVYE